MQRTINTRQGVILKFCQMKYAEFLRKKSQCLVVYVKYANLLFPARCPNRQRNTVTCFIPDNWSAGMVTYFCFSVSRNQITYTLKVSSHGNIRKFDKHYTAFPFRYCHIFI